MTKVTLIDKSEWDVSQMPLPPYVTARELITALSKVNPDAWMCTESGALSTVVYEPHANEPFVALSHVPVKTDLAVPHGRRAGDAL